MRHYLIDYKRLEASKASRLVPDPIPLKKMWINEATCIVDPVKFISTQIQRLKSRSILVVILAMEALDDLRISKSK